MSAEIVNLKQFRKQKKRMDKKRQAVANRTKFGRTKGEMKIDQHESERAKDKLSGHEFEEGPEPA
jgi:hypothetical protein